MGQGYPKLMLKVELPNRTDVKFTLIQVADTYIKKVEGSKFLFTDNGWTIYKGKRFSLIKKGILSLPEVCLRQTTKVHFADDDERYQWMKGMIKALECWSGSHFFKGQQIYGTPKIDFHKTVWIIF